MGQEVSVTRIVMPAVHYGLTLDGEINWRELEEMAVKHKPKIIWAGGNSLHSHFSMAKIC